MSDDDFNVWQKKLILAVVIALIGGNAGWLFNKGSADARHDPFTGTQAHEMERRLDGIYSEQQKMIYRMGKAEGSMDTCRATVQGHLRQHP